MIFQRTILDEIRPWLKTPEAVIITGMRRTGKTTLLVIVQPPRHEGTKKNKNIMKTGKYWQTIIIY